MHWRPVLVQILKGLFFIVSKHYFPRHSFLELIIANCITFMMNNYYGGNASESETITTTPLTSKTTRHYNKFILKFDYKDHEHSINVENFYRISTVKNIIKDKIGVDEKVLVLLYGEDVLKDDQTLDQVHVDKTQRYLHITLNVDIEAKIQILTTDMPLNCTINKFLTVFDLQKALEKQLQIPIEEQYLIYNGNIMDGKKTLLSYNFNTGAILEFVRRPISRT